MLLIFSFLKKVVFADYRGHKYVEIFFFCYSQRKKLKYEKIRKQVGSERQNDRHTDTQTSQKTDRRTGRQNTESGEL